MGQWVATPIFLSPFQSPAISLKAASALRSRDVYFGGAGRITGTVKEKGTPDLPVVRRVWLHVLASGIPICETWSAPDGAYAFDRLDVTQRYFVVAFDHNGNYRAVIADNLTPVVPA
ncbi:MAG: hypothetical protein IPP91_17600 [Betaproteobacteria bacterium]|nr:hypothetical protein [Betaproteobacteria bacterium]